jgi:hypothetical protein
MNDGGLSRTHVGSKSMCVHHIFTVVYSFFSFASNCNEWDADLESDVKN